MPSVFVPALRGRMGDWVYYSCLFTLEMLAEKVKYANELHPSKLLSNLIQRELDRGRAAEIAEYLKESQRFFSSLVIAVYGGDPEWLEIGRLKPPKNAKFDEADIPETVRHSIGFLRLRGDERLFAIDGQHRLAGVKAAVSAGEPIAEDEVSVLLVAHKLTKPGFRRSRRLFTTLNRRAVPVSKGEIIALDEDDTMAICVRRFLEESELFTDERLADQPTNNLPVGDTKSITTIGNLYDVLSVLFEKCKKELSHVRLRYNRPKDTVIDAHYLYAQQYFASPQNSFPVLRAYFNADEPTLVVQKHRGDFGGNVLLRPVGLLLFTEIIAILHEHYLLSRAIGFAATLPQQLDKPPYADILWDTRGKKMIPAGRPLVRRLLLYVLGDERSILKSAVAYTQKTGDTQPGRILLDKLRGDELPLSKASLQAAGGAASG